MIWNNKVLFLHVPKTAGMSMTEFLLKALPDKVFITGPYEEKTTQKVRYLTGKRHETMYDAESFFTYRNTSIFSFEKIFSVMRNPYDLELSRYTYLKKNLPQDRGPAQTIATSSDFKTYLKKAPFFGMTPPRLDLYYHFNGQLPQNLVILKFESLEKSIAKNLSAYLDKNIALPLENTSKHRHYKEIYDMEMEQLCYERHKWFFEKGFYLREDF